jgi:hypothetical protein
MAVISETSISLRFFGDDLNPDTLTMSLGRAATTSATKGQVIKNETTGRERIARSGSWLFSVERREPGDLDAQIRELFDALTPDLSIWGALAAKYKPDLFVGLFMKEINEGDEISAHSLGLLSSRGVSLSLDIYGPLREPSG